MAVTAAANRRMSRLGIVPMKPRTGGGATTSAARRSARADPIAHGSRVFADGDCAPRPSPVSSAVMRCLLRRGLPVLALAATLLPVTTAAASPRTFGAYVDPWHVSE